MKKKSSFCFEFVFWFGLLFFFVLSLWLIDLAASSYVKHAYDDYCDDPIVLSDMNVHLCHDSLGNQTSNYRYLREKWEKSCLSYSGVVLSAPSLFSKYNNVCIGSGNVVLGENKHPKTTLY